jgi:uncharacterized membrane protein
MVDGQIYETDFDGLKDWVAEGCFHATDKVKKGSLNWIEAGKVPMLRRLFVGTGAPAGAMPPPMAPAPAFNPAPAFSAPASYRSGSPAGGFGQPGAPSFQGMPGGQHFVAPMPPVPAGHRPHAGCYNHPNFQPKFMCKSCANTFCNDCVKFVNGRIPLCTLCGELCDVFEKVRQRAQREHFRKSGFGFEDFGSALAYPFKHPVSLIAGALMYSLLQVAGLFGTMAGYMLIFGCMTLTIRQVAWGRLDRCFMPDDDFSFWDDMIHPAILGIGVTIVTWGPAIVMVVVLFFNVMSNVNDARQQSMASQQTESAEINPQDLDDLNNPNPAISQPAARRIENSRSFSGPQAQSISKRNDQQVRQFMSKLILTSLPILGILVLTLIWAFLYYPMALTVAGYTQAIGSVLNPLVGLDTIKRMGGTYVKAFLMYLAVGLVSLVVTIIIMIITSPFDMPIVGNLPGKVLNGVSTFYTSLVIACILGLSLFKSSDKLNILTD